MTNIAIIGAGSWATALAQVLARNNHRVLLWARRRELADAINNGENQRYLPGVTLHPQISADTDLARVLAGATAVVFGVPSHCFRRLLQQSLPFIKPEAVIINVAKGLEESSRQRLSEVFAAEAGADALGRYAVLSGPSHAEEVGCHIPTAVVAASQDIATAGYVQDLFMTRDFRVYTNPDLVGVELGGALKNIIALGTGIADGLGYGDNTKAAMMTRGLAEITRLGLSMGANLSTFAGLAGVGDLIVTCTSMHSRNRRCGIAIGQGKTLDEAVAGINMVVEGVRTTRVAWELAREQGVEMPITEQIYKVLFENLSPREAVLNLMGRGKKLEVEETVLSSLNWTM
ncbi:NAD(P)H-dependent glycerol-3-phosphate dehydrogenase [Desulforamulus hydrothermalis]|uniref:Glycerol-3-phosphate dehydrogenase [NAD(P)+] n=1 Tax=Desulforamulus hydrothermalis Lam5 = DSM 18033 TaxID=1121428 RepID=K8E0F4_9FIRM|nr:NAD(P)H-dependent glycerol-3-phosphate dehydrogenase [Desulforamulus hydrothermalis]CCO09027.1 Glycerol-3-phosphate dehydrogenase (NAD(P)+) [Desulforamulus hydrothermalis Lam5 = DSM 18033]SHG77271.1 glycerol 3-phosphate dehydrogenase (NAD(P)+) [Desulforamulus hydrothermalis Lam5 = DSM 18033]